MRDNSFPFIAMALLVTVTAMLNNEKRQMGQFLILFYECVFQAIKSVTFYFIMPT